MLAPVSSEELSAGGMSTSIDMQGLTDTTSSFYGVSASTDPLTGGSHLTMGMGSASAPSASFGRGTSSSAKRSGSFRSRSNSSHSSTGGMHVFKTCSAFPEYFSRMLDVKQMDLDATFYQMVTLCVQPSKVYKSAYYRKQTRNRWSRDDPAFLVIQLFFLIVATVAWAVAFHVSSFSSYVSLLVHAILIEWLGFGLVLSTTCWWLANKYLRIRGSHGIGDTFFVEQHVEWQYAFDIHCNSFFILFLFLYALQFLVMPLFQSNSFLSLLFANLLYTLAWGFYIYVTFLGYMALPFLHRTERFLRPLVVVIALFLASVALQVFFGIAINCSQLSIKYYYPLK